MLIKTDEEKRSQLRCLAVFDLRSGAKQLVAVVQDGDSIVPKFPI